MMPSFSLSSSSSSSSSSVSTTIRVDKATSELLAGPDWTINMEICDLCNSNHWMAKDVVKGVKRRLKHKNPRVQLLTLTLLETMVKNCGEYIHYQIAERKILDEMVKIVKKKGDMHVRDKILMLLDSWQEAFGGPGGKYSQYYWACDELRRLGAIFPQRSERAAPVITPPVTHQPTVLQIGYGMPSDSSRRLDEAMTSEVDKLSSSSLESMRNALDLLTDMLQAVNYADPMAVKDEVITDLVESCRANQKKLMQMITTTTDEDLLARGLDMNDSLQTVLAKHDALASGNPLPPDHERRISTQQSESVELNSKASEAGGDKHPTSDGKSTATHVSKDQVEDDEEEEDEFLLLSRRHTRSQQSGTSCVTEDGPSSSGRNNALALIDTPGPAQTTTTTTTNNPKEQDLIDLMSLVLTTPSPSEPPVAPISSPVQTTSEASFNSYVVPWAQSQPQPQPQPMMTQYQNQYQPMMQPQIPSQTQFQNQYQPMQPQMPPQTQHGYSQYGSSSPPPPWDATSGYNTGSNPYMYSNYQANMNYGSLPPQNVNNFQYPQSGNQPVYSATQNSANFSPTTTSQPLQHSNSFQNPPSPNSSIATQGAPSLQHTNSFPPKASSPSALNGSTLVSNGSSSVPPGQKPFVPSYRLFDDLNILGGSESKVKNGPYPSSSGNSPRIW